ncbi:hypothetical protein [Nocardia sp. NPDC051832]
MPAHIAATVIVFAALPYGLWAVYALGKLRDRPAATPDAEDLVDR